MCSSTHISSLATYSLPQGQWPEEITKFLGSSKKVLVLKDLSALNKIDILDIQTADIVVVSFAVLGNDKYFSRLARLSGVNAGSLSWGSNGGRHFAAVYRECLAGLRSRVSQILNGESVYGEIEETAAAHARQQAEGSLRLDGKKAAYKNGSSASHVKAFEIKTAASDRDPWGLSKLDVKHDWTKMKCAPLEMFHWNRLVVDE